jgi:hypothetical protein
MEQYNNQICQVERFIKESLRVFPHSKKEKKILYLVFALFFFLSISLFVLPAFINIIILIAIALIIVYFAKGYLFSNKESIENALKYLEKIGDSVEFMTKKLNENEALISQHHQHVSENEDDTSPLKSYQEDVNEILKGDFITLLQTLQTLDISSSKFGESCHKYMRNEAEEAALMCEMRFVDYLESTKDCYNVEYVTNRNEIFYVKRAIIRISDNQIVLKGKVFLPKKEAVETT